MGLWGRRRVNSVKVENDVLACIDQTRVFYFSSAIWMGNSCSFAMVTSCWVSERARGRWTDQSAFFLLW